MSTPHRWKWMSADDIAEVCRLYRSGIGTMAIGRLFNRNSNTILERLRKEGIPIRPFKGPKFDPRRRVFIAAPPITPERRREIIAEWARPTVPPSLKVYFRKMTMAERAECIAEIRAASGTPERVPADKLSPNVTRFDYCTPEAQAITARLNQGQTSRSAGKKLNIISEGVIWQGELWHYCPKAGFVCGIRGTYHATLNARKLLHHEIYRAAHGEIPPGHVVRFRDGSWWNMRPENMYTTSRNLVARENQGKHLQAQSRAHTAAVLRRAQTHTA